jgi:ABC-type sulfate transport system permease component
MTDETGTGASGAKGMLGGLSTGEMVLGLSAVWVFLIVYVIGNRLADDYFNSPVTVPAAMASLAIVAAIYFYHSGGDGSWRSLYR